MLNLCADVPATFVVCLPGRTGPVAKNPHLVLLGPARVRLGVAWSIVTSYSAREGNSDGYGDATATGGPT
ncbi:Uncharacterised protein [Mycolicibacterium phlei]|nr:Uncharacterised protein [Mycolicibacterium phlei]